jgi:hypothetical protein
MRKHRASHELRLDLDGPSVAIVATVEGGVRLITIARRDGEAWTETERLAEYLADPRIVREFLALALYIVGRIGEIEEQDE